MGIERINEFWPEWRIGDILGEGSFGKVYSAEKTVAGCTTTAAIKVISIPSSNAELDALESEGMTEEETTDYFKEIVDDFVNEIKLMITLKGAPNIVSVEDYNILPCKDRFGWDIYIRMERLTSFKDYQKTHKMTLKDTVKLGCDIATALEICQQRNIIHRDIKPANIFIDSFGNFKLGDFGVAKQLGKTTGAASSKGTFTYMAPEVTKGERYNQSVDIYSLGIVLYSLLNNNRPPFIAATSQKVGYNERSEANSRRLSGESLPPIMNIPTDLSNVIQTACAYSPNLRFKTAAAFKKALSSCDLSAPVIKPVDPDATVIARVNANPVISNTPSHTEIIDKPDNYQPLPQSKVSKKKIILISAVILIPIILIVSAVSLFLFGRMNGFFEIERVGGTTVILWQDEITLRGDGGLPKNLIEESRILKKYQSHAQSLVIKEGITSISAAAFMNFTELEEITLPSTLVEIGDNAFTNCENIKSITIPENVEIIGIGAFMGCEDLETVELPDSLETIESSAFMNCGSIEEITIPENVIYLYECSFYNCSSLEEVRFKNPDTLYWGAFNTNPELIFD